MPWDWRPRDQGPRGQNIPGMANPRDNPRVPGLGFRTLPLRGRWRAGGHPGDVDGQPGVAAGRALAILCGTPRAQAGAAARRAGRGWHGDGAGVALNVEVILTYPVYFISDYPYKIYRGRSE